MPRPADRTVQAVAGFESGGVLTVGVTPTGSSSLGVAFFGFIENGAAAGVSDVVVTYGGATMTLLRSVVAGSDIAGLWVLSGAASGTQNIVIDKTASGYITVDGAAIVYSGVTGFGADNIATGTSTSPSLTLTSTADDIMLACEMHFDFGAGNASTPGGGQTAFLESPPVWEQTATYQDASATSTTASYTLASSTDWNVYGVIFQGSGGGGGLSIPVAMRTYRNRRV